MHNQAVSHHQTVSDRRTGFRGNEQYDSLPTSLPTSWFNSFQNKPAAQQQDNQIVDNRAMLSDLSEKIESTNIRDEYKSALSGLTHADNFTPRTFEDNVPLALSNTNRLTDT